MSSLRITAETLVVMRYLREAEPRDRYGLACAHSTGVASGTVTPILHRLVRAGLASSAWEDGRLDSMSRPRRRYFALTERGEQLLVVMGTEPETPASAG